MQLLPYWAVKRVEKFAIRALPIRPSRGELQHGAVGKCHDFLDIPPMAAYRDDIAGGEHWQRHGSRQASGVPEETRGKGER